MILSVNAETAVDFFLLYKQIAYKTSIERVLLHFNFGIIFTVMPIIQWHSCWVLAKIYVKFMISFYRMLLSANHCTASPTILNLMTTLQKYYLANYKLLTYFFLYLACRVANSLRLERPTFTKCSYILIVDFCKRIEVIS